MLVVDDLLLELARALVQVLHLVGLLRLLQRERLQLLVEVLVGLQLVLENVLGLVELLPQIPQPRFLLLLLRLLLRLDFLLQIKRLHPQKQHIYSIPWWSRRRCRARAGPARAGTSEAAVAPACPV